METSQPGQLNAGQRGKWRGKFLIMSVFFRRFEYSFEIFKNRQKARKPHNRADLRDCGVFSYLTPGAGNRS